MYHQYSRPNRYRFLYLIRHGQYVRTEEHPDGELTDLGKEQSVELARHLRESGVPIAKVWCSTMYRAEHTANIVCEEAFPQFEPQRAHLLRERIFPGHEWYEDVEGSLRAEPDLLDRVFDRWVRPSRSERHELLFCHGNLIRAIAMRAMDAPIENWYRPHIYHCSISQVVAFDHDRISLASLNNHGFLDLENVTSH